MFLRRLNYSDLKSLIFIKFTSSYTVSIINNWYLRFEISLAQQIAYRRGLFDRNNVLRLPERSESGGSMR